MWRKCFSKKKIVETQKIFSEIFFLQIFYLLGPRQKQEANRCHGCIRNELSKWVSTHNILRLNNMSKAWQKHSF